MQQLLIPMRLFRILRPATRIELRRALQSNGTKLHFGPNRTFLHDTILMAWQQDDHFVWVREAYANHVASDLLERKFRVARHQYCQP